MRFTYPDESASRVIAAATAAAILLLIGKLLLRGPMLPTTRDDDALRVVYLERPRWSPSLPPPAQAGRPPEASTAQARDMAVPSRAVAPADAPRVDARRPAPSIPIENRVVDRLYDRDTGRARLPPQARIDPMAKAEPPANPPGLPNERELKRARDLLYPPNPIEVDPDGGPFGGTWASDGTLGQQAARKLGDGLAAIGKKIFGEERQTVRARPPPDVGFNPQNHDNASDLGRAGTGNAYKAAPIAYEKAPGLSGEASRRIRTALEALQKRAASCDAARVQKLLATVRGHLTELEQVEYAIAHGADPVMARQMLPRRGDTAYDQARRALWYAENQLGACVK
nr:hypothetical protein [Pseudoxanthomonas sp.]